MQPGIICSLQKPLVKSSTICALLCNHGDKSLANAAKAITFVDRAYIYDNSVDNQLPRLLYRITDGKPFKRYTDDIPLWAQTIIG